MTKKLPDLSRALDQDLESRGQTPLEETGNERERGREGANRGPDVEKS